MITDMKKLVILALLAVIMAGCVSDKAEDPIVNGYRVIEIDSCEYLETVSHGYTFVRIPIHKGNCKFCKERRQKELEELITKLKEK